MSGACLADCPAMYVICFGLYLCLYLYFYLSVFVFECICICLYLCFCLCIKLNSNWFRFLKFDVRLGSSPAATHCLNIYSLENPTLVQFQNGGNILSSFRNILWGFTAFPALFNFRSMRIAIICPFFGFTSSWMGFV